MKRTREPRDIAGGIRLSLSSLALELGVSRDTVKRVLDRADVAPAARNRGNALYRLRDVLAVWLRSPESGFDPDRLPAAQRAQHYRAESEKLAHLERAGLVVGALDVERRFAGIIKDMLQFHEAVTDMLERDHGATPAMIAGVVAMFARLRVAFHAHLIEQCSSDGNGDSKPATKAR